MSYLGHPVVAVVGRQNVGKSSLVNRLFGRREAIAHETPGVTRDRVETEASWRGRRFRLFDTGGFSMQAKGIEALVSAQATRATEVADLVLLVVDVAAGPTEEDAALAKRLMRIQRPVLVVANKVDTEREEADASDFYALGLGEPVPVSALHGRGAGDLLDRIVRLLPDPESQLELQGEPATFAIVGRPNVGKSSLFNLLVGEERSVVFEQAGTTRDAVDSVVSWNSRPLRFVDTAGLRRPSKTMGVEYYSLLRSTQAIRRAHVALLVLDASDGFTSEDKRIAARVMDAGRGLLVAANKWDIVQRKDDTFGELKSELASFAGAEVLRTSALRRTGVPRLCPALLGVHDRWSKRISTGEVNRLLQIAQGEKPAPGVRYRYGTQVSAGPPSFVLFGGRDPGTAYSRFLENRLRRELGFEGVPIRVRFRSTRRGQG